MALVGEDDFYRVLEVGRGASHDEIKKAYRKMALKYHPDRNPGNKDAEQKFKKAAEAYEILGDPEKRARYDKYGRGGIKGAEAHFTSFDEIFEHFSDVFGGGGMFEDLFGAQARTRTAARRGASLRIDVEVELREVATGVEKTIALNRRESCDTCSGTGVKPGTSPKSCPQCGGSGEVQHSQGFFVLRTTCGKCGGQGRIIEHPCLTCHGNGRVAKRHHIKVKVPAGVEGGVRLRVAGQGEPGENGAPSGDLYCDIHVKPNPIFTRQGSDLVCELPISFTQAALGTEVDVPTLMGGIKKVKIPRGTQPGDVISVRGDGLPSMRGWGKGQLMVRVVVETPVDLTARQEEILREFGTTENKNLSPKQKSFLRKMKEYFR
ncbi:MAG: molecular chaperone DnaJ [Candidatus Brocadiales bacterium]